jgi:tetratricopeptide (TPR) repeat protein
MASAVPANVLRLLRRAERARAAGDLDKAERLYNAVLAHAQTNFDALYGLGQIKYLQGDFATALALFQQALKCDGSRAEGFASLGLVFYSLKDFHRALQSYDEGLRLAPCDAELLNRRGVVFLDLGRFVEALADFERALELAPGHLDASANRGNALFKLNRPAQAIEVYDRVLERMPGNAALLTNRAIALRRLDRPQESLLSAARAIAAEANFAPARFVEASVRLYLGDFATGWAGYEWREGGSRGPRRRKLAAPLWLGKESIAGKTILLHAEQGFGDTIQFVRYAPLVAGQGARVILEAQPQLVRLFSGMPGLDTVLARGAPLPCIDCHCPLLSLPLALGTTIETTPTEIPYIISVAEEATRWRMRLPRRRPLVGLAWSGERAHDNDVNRSMKLAALAPLLDRADVQFVSLQHDVREDDKETLRGRPGIVQIGHEFSDFADTAAAIAGLDAVVSVDTAVAHLAGAMNKPLFLLLPFAADFRWLRERRDSPWYPSARLFRQQRFGDWTGAVEKVAEELACLPAKLVPLGERVQHRAVRTRPTHAEPQPSLPMFAVR